MPTTCLNCGSGRAERFCPACGQEVADRVVPIGSLARELLDEFLKFDAKILSTLAHLLIRPGFLTVEYLRGRRASYLSPLKLYLAISTLFFVLFTLNARVPLREAIVRARADVGSSRPAPSPAFVRKQERARRVNEWYIENLATVLILMVPFYAVASRLLYRGSKRLYVEHLIFNLHSRSVLLLASIPFLLIPSMDYFTWSTALTYTLMPFYFYPALRRVFGGPRWATLLRAIALPVLQTLATAALLSAVVAAAVLFA